MARRSADVGGEKWSVRKGPFASSQTLENGSGEIRLVPRSTVECTLGKANVGTSRGKVLASVPVTLNETYAGLASSRQHDFLDLKYDKMTRTGWGASGYVEGVQYKAGTNLVPPRGRLREGGHLLRSYTKGALGQI